MGEGLQAVTAQAQVLRGSYWAVGDPDAVPAFRAEVEGRDPGDRPRRLVPALRRLPVSKAMASQLPPEGPSAQELHQGKGLAPEVQILTGVHFGPPHIWVTLQPCREQMRLVTET